MSKEPKIGEKKKFHLPHIFIILFFIVLLCTILTWIIPAGEFDRVENEAGRMVVVPGTWHEVDPSPVGFFYINRKVIRVLDNYCREVTDSLQTRYRLVYVPIMFR